MGTERLPGLGQGGFRRQAQRAIGIGQRLQAGLQGGPASFATGAQGSVEFGQGQRALLQQVLAGGLVAAGQGLEQRRS
ncbi:MAG: hypothetical protein KA171_18125 [Reyranella sp.]|nr:hypothetical protein [Reyranella sp.]